MFLELDRLNVDNCHALLQPAIALFKEDKPVEAMSLAWTEVRKCLGDTSADDWLLLGNLANICGLGYRSRGCYRIGHSRFPEDGRLAALYAWDLSAIGQSHRCMQVLKQGLEHDKQHAHLLRAIACYNHSLNSWKKTAIKFHKSAFQNAGDDAIVAYVLARSAARRTDWDLSLTLNEKAIELSPGWTRAKMGLFDVLLCADQRSKAGKLLQSSLADQKHIWRDFSVSTWLEITNEHDKAIEHLEKTVDYYPPNSKMMKFAARQLLLLLMKSNQIERARKVTDRFNIRGFEEWEELLTDDQRQKYISVPLVAQTTNHCVPTVAAMVAKAQGFETTPSELAQKMDTRHGTPMWRMTDTMKQLGFQITCVKPEVEIVEKMLEQNVPLIGEISGVLSGHVDVVCGFNSGLKLFHLRDPMHWYGMSLPYDVMEAKYEASCSLWAMVAPDNIDSVVIEPEWINHEAIAMIDLGRAIASGERVQAEDAFAKIGDDHKLSFARDCMARYVVLTDRETNVRLKKEVETIDPDTELTLPQVRSLLAAIDEDNADHILEIARKNSERLGNSFVDYVHSQVMLCKMQWKKAEKKLTAISRKQPGNERVWSQLARVKTELGKSKDAEKCFEIALEISPDREVSQSEGIFRLEHKIPFDEQLKKAKAVEAQLPWSTEILHTIASLMRSSGDGMAYEAILKKCIRFFPRNPYYYHQLSSWYMLQSRKDLACEVMAAGHELMSESDFPVADFEKSPEELEQSAETEKADGEPKTKEVPTAELVEPGNAFRRNYATLVEKAYTVSFEEFQASSELVESKNVDRSHLLNWQQSAELLSLQIRNLMIDQSGELLSDPAKKVDALRKILPVSVRGIGESFAAYVIDSLDFESASQQFIREILDWFSKIAPESHKYPDVEFQRAWLLELCREFNNAEEVVNQIIREHPCYVAGWFRLGGLHAQRQEHARAFEMYEKCLELLPGHYGSLFELSQLAPYVDQDRLTSFHDAICKYLPYNPQYVYEAAMTRIDNGHEVHEKPAINFIDSRAKLLGASKHATTKARLLADVEKYPQAIAALDEVKIDQGDEYAANWVRVDVAVREERFEHASDWLDKLEKTNPNDESVVDQKVRLLRIQDPKKAQQYAEKQILDGKPLPILAHVAIAERNNALAYTKKTIENADEKNRDLTALAFHEAIAQMDDIRLNHGFLDYCHSNLSHLTQLSEAFVYQLGMQGKTDRSIKIARELYAREQDNPRFMSLLGWAVQDTNPQESIGLLRNEFELTDSVETLAKLARGYQINGDHTLAEETYRKVLRRNPNDTVSLTNMMFKYGSKASELMPNYIDTIQKQMVHASDQYFLAQAVKMAVEQKTQLPPEWISLAFARLEQMELEAPFRDESKLLIRAVYLWMKAWGAKNTGVSIGLFEKIVAKFSWPGTKWIPPKP